jgi:hypothetical protein
MKYKVVTLGLVLAGTALGSAALTLGRARGAAWIGQPLELVVPVQVDAGQPDGGLCAEADVYHGDSRQDSSKVRVLVSPTDQPDTFSLKISSLALIDEPIVSVYLRAGCAQKSSRKYVLLADFPSDTSGAQSRVTTPTAPTVPMVVPTAIPTGTPASAAGTTASTAAPQPASPALTTKAPEQAAPVVKPKAKEVPTEPVKVVTKPPVAKKEHLVKPNKPAAPRPVAKLESSGKPRLRLDPIETLSERVKTLESTTTASSLQDDLTRDNQKMQQLQGDLRTLLQQASKNEAALAAMRERLEKAEADRVPVAVVYGLLALVILAMGALAFLWSKRPRSLVLESPVDPATRAPGKGKTVAHDVDLDVIV